jgi:D-threo-aldose 1-dehydrogenase
MDPFAKRRLGRSKLEVSVLGLGGAPLGDFFARLDEDTALATIAEAYKRGVRLFDTAPLYGQGKSEHRFGHVLRALPKHDFVLSTKVGRHTVPEKPEKVDHSWFKGGLNFRPVFDYSYDGTMRAVEQSFQRLGIEQIDVLLIHDVDIWTHGTKEAYEQRFREAMAGAHKALVELRSQGVVSAIGIGVNEVEPSIRFATEGDIDCIMLAGRYTLLEHLAVPELLPLAQKKGISFLIAGPYNSGILATGAIPGAKYNYVDAPPEIMAQVARIEAVCKRHNVPIAAAALQFPLGHPNVAAMVPGAVTPQEVERNIALMGAAIPGDLWAELKHEKLLPAEALTPG